MVGVKSRELWVTGRRIESMPFYVHATSFGELLTTHQQSVTCCLLPVLGVNTPSMLDVETPSSRTVYNTQSGMKVFPHLTLKVFSHRVQAASSMGATDLFLGGRRKLWEIESVNAQSVVKVPHVFTQRFQQTNCTHTNTLQLQLLYCPINSKYISK